MLKNYYQCGFFHTQNAENLPKTGVRIFGFVRRKEEKCIVVWKRKSSDGGRVVGRHTIGGVALSLGL
jgi:hypothetical protein